MSNSLATRRITNCASRASGPRTTAAGRAELETASVVAIAPLFLAAP